MYLMSIDPAVNIANRLFCLLKSRILCKRQFPVAAAADPCLRLCATVHFGGHLHRANALVSSHCRVSTVRHAVKIVANAPPSWRSRCHWLRACAHLLGIS